MAKETFRIIAIDETHGWAEETITKYGIRTAFGLYMFREGERTYCCSTSASTWCEFIENVFILNDDADGGEWDGCRDSVDYDLVSGALAYEGGSENDCYIDYVDVKSYDPRFLGERLTFKHISARDYKGGTRSSEYHTAIFDAAREAFNDGNGYDQPAITDPNIYREYEAELAAKRRAENVRPLAGRDQLPLFVAAAKRLPERVVVTLGWLDSYIERYYARHPDELAEGATATVGSRCG